MFFLPLLGVEIAFHQNLIFALIMTVISIARSFTLRRVFEALRICRPLSAFAQAVIAERFRQIETEGWSFEHDDAHWQGELARAGAAYARMADINSAHQDRSALLPPVFWPWSKEWWKPTGFRRDLVKACALILAEGEKFDRNRGRLVRVDDRPDNSVPQALDEQGRS